VDRNELGFNAWILVGNVLRSLSKGVNGTAIVSRHERLVQLDVLLEPIGPTRMLETLQNLPAEDRQLLLDACIGAQLAAGTEAETTLGLNEAEAAPVLAFLREPGSFPTT
jgi:hypothetical protein